MYTTWALLSLCLLVTPASHGAGEGGTAATGERQATEASSDQALAARIKDALGKEPVLRDATNLSVVARKDEVTLSGDQSRTLRRPNAQFKLRGGSKRCSG
jgi:osmotically-inducible protein OsmY